jgi:hypothetical protein
MRTKAKSIGFTAVLALSVAALFMTPTPATAQTETVIYNFGQTSTDAFEPYYANLLLDGSGNLYGLSVKGGAYGDGGGPLAGTVYELKPRASSGWNEAVLHSFNPSSGDGFDGFNGLIMDAAGNIYGTTYLGGTSNNGTVFEMVHGSSGWSERIIHSFGAEGMYPTDNLILDAAGNLYGGTSQGGASGNGMIFELMHTAGGGWAERVLLSFDSTTGPAGPLMLDGSGNLYSSTGSGGVYGYGMVFELMRRPGGVWTEKVLYNFQSATDANGGGPLIMDSAGNIYGLTAIGGIFTDGSLFKLKPLAGGAWSETVLYSFLSGCELPQGNFVRDASGNFFGACYQGGPYFAGGVFEVSPGPGGTYTETTLHNFGNTGDGGYVRSGVTADSSGNLFGTTVLGGLYGGGTVWELTP